MEVRIGSIESARRALSYLREHCRDRLCTFNANLVAQQIEVGQRRADQPERRERGVSFLHQMVLSASYFAAERTWVALQLSPLRLRRRFRCSGRSRMDSQPNSDWSTGR